MKRNYLGEFEEVVMLTVGILYPQAYGVAIKKEILINTNRKVTLSAVHAVLHRLQEKNFLTSEFGEATRERGGKRKKYFTITQAGSKSLSLAMDTRKTLWDKIPKVALQNVN